MSDIVYRQFSVEEMQWVFPVFLESLDALLVAMGEEPFCDVQDKEQVEAQWQRRKAFMQHLTQTADNNWVAVRDGHPIGYARSLVRDNVRQLSEMFLVPSAQSNGIGRELLDYAFPKDESRNRIVIASPDRRAVPAYLKRGVYPRFSLYYMERKPEIVSYQTDLQILPLLNTDEHLAYLNRLDRSIIGYVRTIDHQFFINSSRDRTGYLFLRDGQAVGYGYVGKRTGPIALSDVNDFPAVLAFAETEVAKMGHETFGVTVPLINTVSVDYMLSRKARIDMAFLEQFMMAVPMGKFENYICTLPELIT
jgi:GNAT superfamily N-acetyltransferase